MREDIAAASRFALIEMIAGGTTSFAAEKLFIAESTVRAHVHSIYRKCGVHSRMELMDAFDECWMEGVDT